MLKFKDGLLRLFSHEYNRDMRDSIFPCYSYELKILDKAGLTKVG